MLTELRIKNLAILDQVELLLEPGFNVFTGETGAGKSMIVQAVHLLQGGPGQRGSYPHRRHRGQDRGPVRDRVPGSLGGLAGGAGGPFCRRAAPAPGRVPGRPQPQLS